MQTRVKLWGNSLAIRVPKSFASESKLEKDTLVDLTLRNGELIISPSKLTYTLDGLLDQITDENLHSAQEYGHPVGKEAWR